MRFGRLHSEQYEFAGCCDFRGAFDAFGEALFVLHDVVGGHDRQNGVGVVLQRHERRDGNGRCRIAGDRLKNDGVRFETGAIDFLAHEEAVIVVAEKDRRSEARIVAETRQCSGEKARALAAEEANELLRIHRPGKGPEPRAGAARKYDWVDVTHRHGELLNVCSPGLNWGI